MLSPPLNIRCFIISGLRPLRPFSRGKATVISSQSLCLLFPVGRRSLLAVGRWVREKSPAGRKRENAHFVKRRTHHH